MIKKYYRLELNFDHPLGEIEIRRTLKNFPFREKSLEINWDRNEFMPSSKLEGEFSLTDESSYLDMLKASHLGWEGGVVNSKILSILEKKKLQEHRVENLSIYKNNDEQDNFNKPYYLVHFHSNASGWIEKVHYSRVIKKTGQQDDFEVTYNEFIDSEINISISDRIFRKIIINKIEYLDSKFPEGFFDLFYNTFLFKTNFIVSEEMRDALLGASGFSFEEGPVVAGI